VSLIKYGLEGMHYGNTKGVLYIRKVYYMNKIYTQLRHRLPSICEMGINGKNINLLQQT